MEDENEFEGVELAEMMQKTRKCEHEWVSEIQERYTQDARLEKIETKTCTKCGTWRRNRIWAEPVSESAMWN